MVNTVEGHFTYIAQKVMKGASLLLQHTSQIHSLVKTLFVFTLLYLHLYMVTFSKLK